MFIDFLLLFFIWAARLPAVAVGLSALLAALVPAPIPAAYNRDLAVFYKVETAKLNRQVKRNIGRFPEDFMFQLTKKEWESLKCQIGISNVRGGDRRALPYVFTEQGVSQLSGVLHNALAEDISVKIMRAFVAMRRFITANAGLFQRVGVLEQVLSFLK